MIGWLPVLLAGPALGGCIFWIAAVRRDARRPTVRDLRPMWADDEGKRS